MKDCQFGHRCDKTYVISHIRKKHPEQANLKPIDNRKQYEPQVEELMEQNILLNGQPYKKYYYGATTLNFGFTPVDPLFIETLKTKVIQYESVRWKGAILQFSLVSRNQRALFYGCCACLSLYKKAGLGEVSPAYFLNCAKF